MSCNDSLAGGRIMKCKKCGMEQKNLEFWITHQTMSDNTIWCNNKPYINPHNNPLGVDINLY